MSIATLYNKTVATERLTQVGTSNKTGYQVYLSSVSCRIEQGTNDSSFLGEGALYKSFKMWCDLATDIKETDRVVDGTVKYTVRAVKSLSFKRSAHKEVLLELAQ